MHVDARRFENGAIVETDICIVGAGPAGITLARELLELGQRLLILESGGTKANRRAQELNAGEVLGDSYAGLRQTRHRQVGGAANIWNTPVQRGIGAKYVPLDPWDFVQPPDPSPTGWPFDLHHLEPFYRRAQEVCGLGPFAYRGEDWKTADRPGVSLDPHFSTKVYQFGPGGLFTRDFVARLRESPRVQVCYHATVAGLEMEGRSCRVVAARVLTPGGDGFRVRAKRFVLAAGGIENARILLLSADDGGSSRGEFEGLANQHGWVGRCFMEHPRDFTLTLQPYSPRLYAEVAFFDPHEAPDGTIVGGRIGLSEGTVLNQGFPNASVTLLPRIRDRSTLVDWATRFWLCPHSSGRRGFRGGYGWSRMKTPSRWLDGFRLVVNLEQRPNPENRIVLSGSRDPLGLPRAQLHWRWRREEQAALERLRDALAGWIERSGLGRVHIQKGARPDPNACHHAGTTRMSTDPKDGVVDPDCRVHTAENLYVLGSSVFPTAGYANPTLTIVALALRLADHFRQASWAG